MDWLGFINHFEHHHNSPVLLPILKRSGVIEQNNNNFTLSCENTGSKIFLESKREHIQDVYREFAKEEVFFSFVVVEGKKKVTRVKEEVVLPLVEYKNNTEDAVRKSCIVPTFTFENFAVSPTNQIAHAAAQAIADRLGVVYNPLFVYGDVGVGKTHLSHAIANKVLMNDPSKKVLYCTSEEFTNDLVETIRKKSTSIMRSKYRTLDVLIVDDVQFIAGKNYVQEEFYHTFNSIVKNGGQIILTSDRPPKEMKELEDRLRSRFSGGLIIDIQSPDFELRTAILLIKAQQRNIQIDMDAAQRLAERISDTRELEGALLKLLTLSLSDNQNNITLHNTEVEFANRRERATRRLNPQEVVRMVASFYNLTQADIKGSSRKERIALARQVVMFLLRDVFDMNLSEIAFVLRRKDHTTIIHGVSKISEKIMKDLRFRDEIESIKNQFV